MKLFCEVLVTNRLIPGSANGRYEKSSLSIGSSPKNDSQTFLLHFTKKNSTGKRYNLKTNIEQVFCRYVKDGKATIRFKIPSHDLAIKCDSVQLKCFLSQLKLGMTPGPPAKGLKLASLTTTSKLSSFPVSRLVIRKRSDYPTKGFPRTIKQLLINGLKLETFPKQILQLNNLHTLILTDNSIKTVPTEFGNLANLRHLDLSYNCLNLAKLNDWDWLNGKNIGRTLFHLDLKGNKLKVLPNNFIKLEALLILILSSNFLEMLPSLDQLLTLKHLAVDTNKLKYVPYSITGLPLKELELSYNKLYTKSGLLGTINPEVKMSLFEIASRSVLAHGLNYSPAIIPETVVRYLDRRGQCVCNKKVVETYCSVVLMGNLQNSKCRIVRSTNAAVNTIPFKVDLCSKTCFNNMKSRSLDNFECKPR